MMVGMVFESGRSKWLRIFKRGGCIWRCLSNAPYGNGEGMGNEKAGVKEYIYTGELTS